MKFEELLDKGKKTEPTKEEGIQLLKESNKGKNLNKLLQTAWEVRNEELKPIFKFDGFMGTITSCNIHPPCKYCGRSAGKIFDSPLSIKEIKRGAKLISQTGVKQVEIGGGTIPEGAGEKVIKAAEAIRSVAPDLSIWVNVGPSLSTTDLQKFKKLGIIEVCSSLETFNPEVFAEAKPGDSREARMELAEMIDKSGLDLTSVMMVGIGSSYEDYVDHISWFKNFNNPGHFVLTGFKPVPGSPLENRKMAVPTEVAKVGAVARLILREVDISFGGMMNDPRLLPLWIMAGGNRAIHMGPHWHKARDGKGEGLSGEIVTERIDGMEFSDKLPLTKRIVRNTGMKPKPS